MTDHHAVRALDENARAVAKCHGFLTPGSGWEDFDHRCRLVGLIAIPPWHVKTFLLSRPFPSFRLDEVATTEA